MNNGNFETEKTQPNVIESTEQSEISTEKCSVMKEEIKDEAQQTFEGQEGNVNKPKTLTEICATMKEEIKDEAQQIVEGHGGIVNKPKTLTEICATMKEEIKDEAKRLVPGPGIIQQPTTERASA
jgi:poly-beta-hydroxyalkanoate depolymerase